MPGLRSLKALFRLALIGLLVAAGPTSAPEPECPRSGREFAADGCGAGASDSWCARGCCPTGADRASGSSRGTAGLALDGGALAGGFVADEDPADFGG